MSRENETQDKEGLTPAEEEQPELTDRLEMALTEEELLKVCEDQVCPQCRLLKEEKDKTLRALADTENFRKRLSREKDEFCRYALSSFVEEIIPVLDNLELALEYGRKNKTCKDLVDGVEMTLSIFKQTLEKNNLTQVGSIGEEFDPGIHEALAQEERDDMEHGKVCQVMQKGYVLNDRLIRPAKVMVSKKCSS